MYEILYPVIGFCVGLLVGMTGIGAGSVMTPLLLALGLPPVAAVGTDLVHSAASKGVGVFLYLRKNQVNFRFLTYLLAGSSFAFLIGGYFYVFIHETYGYATLNRLVESAIGLVLVATGIIYSRPRPTRNSGLTNGVQPGLSRLFPLGLVIGFCVSITSIGAGAILMPFLMRTMKSARQIVGTDMTYGFVTSLLTGVLQAALGNVMYLPLFLLLAGSIPGMYFGVALNGRVGVSFLRLILAVMITFAGLAVLARLF